MYTAMVLLGVWQAIGVVMPSPEWQRDYKAALRHGARTGKPLAIFIGNGTEGWKDVSAEKELSPDVRKLLAERYVCVYLDTASKSGEAVARKFDTKDRSGIVLSDRQRKNQAYRRFTTVKNTQLAAVLDDHSEIKKKVVKVRTVRRRSVVRPSYYSGYSGGGYSGFAGGGC